MTIHNNTNISFTLLFTFSVYNGVNYDYYRYAPTANDIVVDGYTYTALPVLSAEIAKYTGEVESDASTITIDSTAEIATILSTHTAKPPVIVEITEIDTDLLIKGDILYTGRVSRIKLNPNGLSGSVLLEVLNAKASLQNVSLGIICNTTCCLLFGDSYCKIDKEALAQTRTIAAVSGSSVTLNGVDADFPTYFTRGEITKDGIRITIRSADNLTVTLLEKPPESWIAGTSVVLYPGCDRTRTMCDNRWSNSVNFLGLGEKMPSYTPYIGSL